MSELSGVSNLLFKAEEYGVDLKKDSPEVKELVKTLKTLEHEGYSFEEGEGSFELLLKRTLGLIKPSFSLVEFKTETDKKDEKPALVTASVKLSVGGKELEAKGKGDGPVNALDEALRKMLEDVYPAIRAVKLTDYKVRVLNMMFCFSNHSADQKYYPSVWLETKLHLFYLSYRVKIPAKL